MKKEVHKKVVRFEVLLTLEVVVVEAPACWDAYVAEDDRLDRRLEPTDQEEPPPPASASAANVLE